MSVHQKFREVFNFSQLPKDWQIVSTATDWLGNPLLMVAEGKPPFPKDNPSAQRDWYSIPPKAHHLIHLVGSSQRTVTFEKSSGLVPFGIQPLGDGWLFYDARADLAHFYDSTGQPQKTLHLGGGISDFQTTPNGHIWVSYIDEGVFGDGIGSNGVVAFDAAGEPIFKYHELAEQHDLPHVDDCYAMNVSGEDEVWLCYYSDFPLVSLKGFQLDRAWKDFGCMDRAFAVLRDTVIFPKCYTRREGKSQLLRRTLSDPPQTEHVEATDESGASIGGVFGAAARGAHFYLFTDTALFKLAAL
jgi:hypothetical protein